MKASRNGTPTYSIIFLFFVEDKAKFDEYPLVNEQPKNPRDIYASLVEENSSLLAQQREWEKEWNKSGIMSRLSEQV